MSNNGAKAVIRPAEPTDFSAWQRLDGHCSQDIFEDKVRSGMAFVISVGNETVGVLRMGLFWDHIPFMHLLYIDREYRGMEYGRQAVLWWEEEMRRRGYVAALTSTQVDENAQHFYRKLGYEDCGALVLSLPCVKQPMEMFMIKAL